MEASAIPGAKVLSTARFSHRKEFVVPCHRLSCHSLLYFVRSLLKQLQFSGSESLVLRYLQIVDAVAVIVLLLDEDVPSPEGSHLQHKAETHSGIWKKEHR